MERDKKEVEPFYERFSRIVAASGLSDTDIGSIMGLSAANVGRLKSGQRQSIRLEAGLRLCERLGLDPWELAFGRSRPTFWNVGGTESLPQDAGARGLADRLKRLTARIEKIEKAVLPGEKPRPPRRRKGANNG